MLTEDEVCQVSDQFKAALNHMLNGDAGPMMEVWSHNSDVTTLHPVEGRQIGWEQVRGSFEQFAHLCSSGQIATRDSLIRVGTEAGEGTLAAYLIKTSDTSVGTHPWQKTPLIRTR